MPLVDADTTVQPCNDLLTQKAVEFLRALHYRFPCGEILAERNRRQEQFDLGNFPDFLPETHRSSPAVQWTVESLPKDLAAHAATAGKVFVVAAPEQEALDRALGSAARTVIVDFDDHVSHAWANCLEGHAALREWIDRESRATRGDAAVLFLRPRNWNLEEKHFLVEGEPIAASIFDFGLYCWNWASAQPATSRKPGLYFSLPKLESHQEARMWREIFAFTEEHFGLSRGTIRAIVTIETVAAVFEMDEILFELREYACALECSPCNYLSSFARTFRAHAESLLPQRQDVDMGQPFLRAYQELLIHTSHKRGAQALNAGLPLLSVHRDLEKSQWTRARVRLNAKCEIEMGFDGISVADSDLVPSVLAAFHEYGHNRILPGSTAGECYVTASDLICRAHGKITLAGLRENIAVALEYLEAWLTGHGSLPFAGRMESMATAELCRAQLWQWIRHSARLQSGHKVNQQLVESLLCDQLAATECTVGEAEFAASKFAAAARLLLSACTDAFDAPLAVRAYAHLR